MKYLATKALLIFFCCKTLNAQPWKIKDDFALAFQDSYAGFTLSTFQTGNKIHVNGFDNNDPSKKIFDFDMLPESKKKDGWFNRIDPNNRNSYSIYFEQGIAKSISFFETDSTLSMYEIDSNLLNGVHKSYYSNGNIKEHGPYKNNARIGEWKFYNRSREVIEEGRFWGDYNLLNYDTKKGQLINLNRYLDTIRIEKFAQMQFDSLKTVLNQKWGLAFPIQLYFKDGLWKYRDDSGKLIKQEIYEKGRLIKSENK